MGVWPAEDHQFPPWQEGQRENLPAKDVGRVSHYLLEDTEAPEHHNPGGEWQLHGE